LLEINSSLVDIPSQWKRSKFSEYLTKSNLFKWELCFIIETLTFLHLNSPVTSGIHWPNENAEQIFRLFSMPTELPK
jgi:hypothetical protein